MARRRQFKRAERIQQQRRRAMKRRQNKTIFQALVSWLIPEGELFITDRFHGNIKWQPEQLSGLAPRSRGTVQAGR